MNTQESRYEKNTCQRFPRGRSHRRTHGVCIVARDARKKGCTSTSDIIARRIRTAKNAASKKSNAAFVESPTTQLDCVHIWRHNTRWSSRRSRRVSGRAQKRRGAVRHERSGRNCDGARYRAAPRRSCRVPGRLRQERKIQKKAATRRVERCKTYSAKCAALSQPTSLVARKLPATAYAMPQGFAASEGSPGFLPTLGRTHAHASTEPSASRASCVSWQGADFRAQPEDLR